VGRREEAPMTSPDETKNPRPLTGKQRRHLRALGHALEPVVQIGKQGLTESVIAAVDEALARHELVKVRIGTECPEGRDEVAGRIAPAVKGEVAQILGRTLLIYRRHPKAPKIQLPKDSGEREPG
jgi:RNA-binding protein